MAVTASPTSYVVRRYRDADERAVVGLLTTTLGAGPSGERNREFFRWKHLENPFGRSYLAVADEDGQVIGLRAFLRWEFEAAGTTVRAARAVDTATHPDHQRKGVFARLTEVALRELADEVDLIFNTPNANSMPGYLKLGWETTGDVPIEIRVRRPVRFLRGLPTRDDAPAPGTRPLPEIRAAPAGEILTDDSALTALLQAADRPDERLRTRRTVEHLRWRYADTPGLDYRAVRVGGADVGGIAVFRVRPRGRLWETTVSEILVAEGDLATARRLLRLAVRAADVDHVTCAFPTGSTPLRAVRRSGFLRSPRGLTIVTKPLRHVEPDPTQLGSWALSLGDLEVF